MATFTLRLGIDVCRRVIINKMMNPDSVMIEVIPFNDKIKDILDVTSPKRITTLLELSPPNIDAIKLLQHVVSGRIQFGQLLVSIDKMKHLCSLIEKLNVDQLKSYLMDNKITITGLKKAELVALVYATVKNCMKILS